MNNLLDGLNGPQREAVCHINGPLLVLAGAGSGKTRVITRRVAYLVQQGINPYNILAITFTNKAAGEMQQRIAALRTPYGATVCTFHSLCARLLREFPQQAGLGMNYSIYDRNDQIKVAKQAIERAQNVGERITPARAHAAISNAKNAMQTAKAYDSQAHDFYTRGISEVYHHYEKILAENNAVDFDDLLIRMAFMLRDHADIRAQLSDRFRYILIDEYQDTNRAQYIIAHTLAHAHQNICATGDPDQSIYGWRGADINNILDFEKDYPDTCVIRLEENYRSRRPILTVAAKLIAHNMARKDKKLFTRKEGGADVKIILLDDEKAEAQYIADRVEQYRINGGNYSDIAVFYRVNSQSRVIEDAFMKKGVPYKIARGTEFYNRKEIKDMLAYLKLLANPADNTSCERIINTPPRGIGATTIDRLLAYATANGTSLLGAAKNVSKAGLANAAKKKVSVFAELMTQLAANMDRPVRIIMEDVFRLSGLETLLSQKDEETRQARANVEELISAAADFDTEHPDAKLADYLQGVSLVSDTDHWEGSDGAVMLMTLHAAKGLEFPIVFMAGVEEQMLPFTREPLPGEMEDSKEIEEERRLAFVGITRTMEELTITSARLRTVRGQRQPQQQSRFIDELGTECISRQDKTTEIPASSSSRGGFYGGFSGSLKKKIFDDDWGDFHEAMSRSKKKDNDFEVASGEEGDVSFDECCDAFPIEYEGLQKGSYVSHMRFGRGKVVKISMPWPDTRVEVLFDECGLKKLVLLHAKLRILG